jgi:type III secretion system (T3SS) SseB-like protein
MMAVFTDFTRIPEDISSKAPYAVRLFGRDLLRGLQPGVGLVVNPGTTWGFEILPATVPSIVSSFGPAH